jgi:hypothetical protein
MPLHHALKAAAAARADDVHALAVREDRDVDLVAGLRRLAARLDLDLAAHARRRHTGLLEVALRRLVFLGRLRFDQAQLHGLIAVRLHRLGLDDHARAGFEHGRRLDGPVRREQLRHADFLAD